MIPATSKATTGNESGQRVGMSINDIDNTAPAGYNPFDLSYSFYCTAKAGEVTPFFVQNSVGKTLELLHHSHQVRAYTFNAPLMSQMRMHKAYYSVPMSCIMRHAWPYFFANPNKGDDVPDDCNVLLNVQTFNQAYTGYFDNALKNTTPPSGASEEYIYLRAVLLPTLFYSYNSLFNYVKYPINRCFYYVDNSELIDCDTFYSKVSAIAQKHSGLAISSTDSGDLDVIRFDGSLSSLRDLLSTILYDGGSWEPYNSTSQWTAFITELKEYIDTLTISTVSLNNRNINLDRILAYQLACAQFFSTSTVDYVYNARLWQSNAEGLYVNMMSVNGLPMFDYNGFKIQYDPYSKYWNDAVAQKLSDQADLGVFSDDVGFVCDYYANLLAFNRSLRYVDYFTGGRVQPLSVGDVNAPVTGSNVSAVDITIAIQKQRMLAAANRTGPELREYLAGIFGYVPMTLPSEPHLISSQTFSVQAGQVSNTAELPEDAGLVLGRVVENVNFADSNKAFLAYIDEESIIVGVEYFDYIPAYVHAVDRHAFHEDRFDRFQPYLQTIGEQKVYMAETSFEKSLDPYAYQIRNMEYKQRFSSVAGGFVKDLPGWSLNDDIRSNHINPNTIRQRNSRFDELYSKLTGDNLSSYFHFIISNTFDVTANEPMLVHPQIL